MAFLYLFLAFGVFLVFVVIKGLSDLKIIKQQYAALPGLFPGFRPEKVYLSPGGVCYIALDNTSKRIILGSKIKDRTLGDVISGANPKTVSKISYRIVSYSDIISSEGIVQSHTVVKQIPAGFSVNPNFFGGVNGTSWGASTEVYNKTDVVKLKILLSDPINPSYEAIFYNRKAGVYGIEMAMRDCQIWSDTLNAALSVARQATVSIPVEINKPFAKGPEFPDSF